MTSWSKLAKNKADLPSVSESSLLVNLPEERKGYYVPQKKEEGSYQEVPFHWQPEPDEETTAKLARAREVRSACDAVVTHLQKSMV